MFLVEDDNTVWSVNKVIQYDPITLLPLGNVDKGTPELAKGLEATTTTRETYLRSLKYFSLKSEYKKVAGIPSQKMTVDEMVAGILDKEKI